MGFDPSTVMAFVVILSACEALADTPSTSPTTVDLNWFIQWVLSVGGTVIAASVPIVVTFLLRKWGLDKNQAIAQMVTDAATRGAGIAYDHIVTSVPGVPPIVLRDQAIKSGFDYVKDAFPQFTKSYGLTDDKIKLMVQGELGKLLAQDPGVTAGTRIGVQLAPIPENSVAHAVA